MLRGNWDETHCCCRRAFCRQKTRKRVFQKSCKTHNSSLTERRDGAHLQQHQCTSHKAVRKATYSAPKGDASREQETVASDLFPSSSAILSQSFLREGDTLNQRDRICCHREREGHHGYNTVLSKPGAVAWHTQVLKSGLCSTAVTLS